MSVSVQEATLLIAEHISSLGEEARPLEDCVGRVLTRTVVAAIPQPPFPRSPLDGYALRAADLTGAGADSPAVLPVSAKYYAGNWARAPLPPGCAARVMTGAMLPQGADCVVRQEDTDEGEAQVRIFRTLRPWENYVFAGEDFEAGGTLLSAGIVLDAAAVAVAAAAGLDRLQVRRPARVTILSTGDELTPPGQPLSPGKIYDSNLYYLRARLAQLGARCVDARVVGDDLAQLTQALAGAAQSSDLVLTTGGVSVGQKDLIPGVLDALGAQVIFQGVRMKPGMPTTFSLLDGTAILSLSGNPFAAAVAFELLGRPILAAMGENASLLPLRRQAVLNTDLTKSSPGGRYVRGILTGGQVVLPEGHSNGQMRSMVGCNCLVDIPPDSGPLSRGNSVEVLVL